MPPLEPLPDCPKCTARQSGHPTGVLMHHQQRTITYRCVVCQHFWRLTAPDPDRPMPWTTPKPPTGPSSGDR